MKKIVFTGGGTVGHVTLNLILIPKFIEAGWEVHYIGDKHGIEHEQIEKSGLDVTFHSIATGKLRRYLSFQNLLDIFKVAFGVLQSLFIIAKIHPVALFSKGGFVSVPPVIATRLLGKPVFIHESDRSMGLANKIAYRFATKVYSTFEQSEGLTKVEHVGAITKVKTTDVDLSVIQNVMDHFSADLKTLLFVGGSGGAKVFNEFITNHPELTKEYNVINLSGDANLNELSQNLYRIDYVTDEYQALMQIADVVVTRGGSNTLFELLAMNKLHLIVPLGREASRGDQLENADYFEAKGYAKQLAEPELSMETLKRDVTDLLTHADTYHKAMAETKELRSQEEFYQLLNQDINKTIKGNA